uniref:Uncharacterized protein n=1 Tax=Mimiviridae sp. ChoanoV1 TaxID=2596887 RepID=A0A5B8IQR9_9VIRU|nr:hypothetical protein 6_36 [Mimiviridae sp. ChoanoV1]
MLEKMAKKYISRLFNLPNIRYNKELIRHQSINSFMVSKKKLNDKNNKTRENIIGSIINNQIPDEYFHYCKRWRNLKLAIYGYIKKLEPDFKTIKCYHKGGRGFNYDFMIEFDGIKKYNIELKFNSKFISTTPQFVSPMNPSQYMTNSYEEFYYHNYLPILSRFLNIPLPEKETYLKNIHNNTSVMISQYQKIYYEGCKSSSKFTNDPRAIDFYNLAKKISSESIETFIKNNELNSSKMSDYLKKSQDDKIYMLFYQGKFYLEKNEDDYKIINITKTKNQFICHTESGKKIKILLRWKNGNGISFPAFQIS